MKKTWKYIICTAGIAIGCLIAFLPPPEGLMVEAMRALGILCAAVMLWITNLIPNYVTSVLMVCCFLLFCGFSCGDVFASFSGSTWWLLVTGFAISAAVSKCGLLKRVAAAVSRKTSSSFARQVLGMTAIGCIASPFIPSTSGKTTLLMPFAKELSASSGYGEKSPPSHGLFVSLYVTIRLTVPLFLSGSALGFMLMALYPQSVQQEFTFLHWTVCTFPWVLSVLVLLASPCAADWQTASEAMARRMGAFSAYLDQTFRKRDGGFAGAKDKLAVIVAGTKAGTGFILREGNRCWLYTNAHVIGNAAPGDVHATLLNNTVLTLGPCQRAQGLDLVRFSLSGPLPAFVPERNVPDIGETITILGNSDGRGVVTEIRGHILGVGPLQVEVDAPFVAGNSGSPVLNRAGRVVGVASYLRNFRNDADWSKKNTRYNGVRRFALRLSGIRWQER